jgi:hypothetical protein
MAQNRTNFTEELMIAKKCYFELKNMETLSFSTDYPEKVIEKFDKLNAKYGSEDVLLKIDKSSFFNIFQVIRSAPNEHENIKSFIKRVGISQEFLSELSSIPTYQIRDKLKLNNFTFFDKKKISEAMKKLSEEILHFSDSVNPIHPDLRQMNEDLNTYKIINEDKNEDEYISGGGWFDIKE